MQWIIQFIIVLERLGLLSPRAIEVVANNNFAIHILALATGLLAALVAGVVALRLHRNVDPPNPIDSWKKQLADEVKKHGMTVAENPFRVSVLATHVVCNFELKDATIRIHVTNMAGTCINTFTFLVDGDIPKEVKVIRRYLISGFQPQTEAILFKGIFVILKRHKFQICVKIDDHTIMIDNKFMISYQASGVGAVMTIANKPVVWNPHQDPTGAAFLNECKNIISTPLAKPATTPVIPVSNHSTADVDDLSDGVENMDLSDE